MKTYSKQFPIPLEEEKPKRVNYGRLWYNGVVVCRGKFAHLGSKKKKLLATGYFRKELFKTTY